MGKPEAAAARTARVVKALVADARRDPAMMATPVDQRLAGLGSLQLKAIVLELWIELANTVAAQQSPDDEER